MELLEMSLSIVAGVCALVALPSGLALLAAGKRMELSLRSLTGLVLTVACLWCMGESMHGRATGPEALLMLVTAIHSVVAIRGKRQMRRTSDVSPFKV